MTRPLTIDTALSLADVILSHSESSPNKVAIKYEDTDLTYEQLNNKVLRLTQQLISVGVKPGDFVVVLLSPCSGITIALLAILRAGAIYTPLDPEHPNSQLAAQYKETKATCTITESAFVKKANNWGEHTLNIADVDTLTVPCFSPVPLYAPEASACIFFTSGTTGKPKGVLGSATAMRDSIIGPAINLTFNSTDTLNSIARFAWSISMLELLAPLVVGGTSLILNRQKALDLNWLMDQAVKCSTFHLPPALLRNFSNFVIQNKGFPRKLSHIRLAWYGGDTFTTDNIASIQQAFPCAQVGTAYGCTEIFGLSHIHFYDRALARPKVLIGKPVTGMSQVIQDGSGRPALLGESGEIILFGARVSQGYLNNPTLNSEKFFIKDGVRYFRTGDFALLTENLDLEFLLRKDSQVKIRGIRIELKEIEQKLSQIDEILESVVLAVAQPNGDKELRAYYVGKTKAKLNTQQLTTTLSDSLADYMIPAKWLQLESMPVTENFKIDRESLSKLEPKIVEDTFDHEIARIWKRLTGLGPTSSDDNFFKMGGNSLFAMQLALDISKEFSTRFEVADVYRNPTLKSQIALISKANTASPDSNKTSVINNIYATRGQVGLFFREFLDRKGNSITCTRYIRSKRAFNESAIRRSIIYLVNRHPTLKTNLKISRPNIALIENSFDESDVQVIRNDGTWTLGVGSHNPLSKCIHKFNIKNSPLLCAILSTMDDGSEILQLTAHHIGADDNSMSRIAKEFIQVYDQQLKNHTTNLNSINLPQVPLNYNDFAIEQYNKINTGEYTNNAKLLANKLCKRLPLAQEDPLLNLNDWDKESSCYAEHVLPRQANHKNFTDYIAAFSWALNKTSSRTSFVFCAHVALRRDSDHTPVVGMYVNLLPIITAVNSTHTKLEHAQRTASDFNEAMSRSDIPYEVILEGNDTLKKNKKFPFDAFVNEIVFADEYIDGYENMIVPTRFATNSSEINMTVMQANKEKLLLLESPDTKNTDYIHTQISAYVDEFLVGLK